MTKKEYMKPAMEVLEADMEQQVLAGSVTEIITDGLDDEDLILPPGGLTGMPWENALQVLPWVNARVNALQEMPSKHSVVFLAEWSIVPPSGGERGV